MLVTPSGMAKSVTISPLKYSSAPLQQGLELYSEKLIFSHKSKFAAYTFFRLLHARNAFSPMIVTLPGIVTLVRLEQSSNSYLPMLVTPSEITTERIFSFTHRLSYILPLPLIVSRPSLSRVYVTLSPHLPLSTTVAASAFGASAKLSIPSVSAAHIASGTASNTASVQSKSLIDFFIIPPYPSSGFFVIEFRFTFFKPKNIYHTYMNVCLLHNFM